MEEVRAETALPAAVGTLGATDRTGSGEPVGGPQAGFPAQTYQVGGQSSAGTGCWQASGPHHLVLLHVGQWGAGGCHCGGEGGQPAGGGPAPPPLGGHQRV